jgi:hypothetical protein
MPNKRSKNLPFYMGLLLFFLMYIPSPDAAAQREHLVYFQDTPYELNVYKIFGQQKGPTLMIIGGIQGNEPGGYLSADLYADLAMKRGNLIVVPRANFYSILLFKRGANGDMNRKFGTTPKKDYDSRIVTILKELISESDFLLNLHDGSGYYSPQYINSTRNPSRYGQSIIADQAEFDSPVNGKTLRLQEMAEKVISVINSQIEDPQYHFTFMNTRTGEAASPYAEQRRSATYYALTKHGIPAFGVETSKNLPTIEMKVRQHNLAINAFLEVFGLEPEQPRVSLHPPSLKYLVISVNNQNPIAVGDQKTLRINHGDTIEVVHVEANYERGLSVDIKGSGTINDFRRPFTITKPTVILAQKDHIKFGRVSIALLPQNAVSPKAVPADSVSRATRPWSVKFFIVEVEGRKRLVADGEQVDAFEGDTFKILDVITDGPPLPDEFAVNFKGFVPQGKKNIGEDRGFLIDTARDLMPRYSLSKTEKIYTIAVERKSKVLARMTIRLNKPELNYVVLRHNSGPRLCLLNGEALKVSPGDRIQVLDLQTNVAAGSRVELAVHGSVSNESQTGALLSFQTGKTGSATLVVVRNGIVMGRIMLTGS